ADEVVHVHDRVDSGKVALGEGAEEVFAGGLAAAGGLVAAVAEHVARGEAAGLARGVEVRVEGPDGGVETVGPGAGAEALGANEAKAEAACRVVRGGAVL